VSYTTEDKQIRHACRVHPHEAEAILVYLDTKLDSGRRHEAGYSLMSIIEKMDKKDKVRLVQSLSTVAPNVGMVFGELSTQAAFLLSLALVDGRPLDSFKESMRRIRMGTSYPIEMPYLAYNNLHRKVGDTNAGSIVLG